MKFIDYVTVTVVAGDGGNGKTSFRQEKFVDRGGPDGGDGGNGGNVVFVASRNHNTLVSFRYHRELAAEPGQAGGSVRKHGRRGKDLLVPVPVGTIVTKEGGEVLADLAEDGQQAVIAQGGRGGFGNAHFQSSVRQAPNFSEKGELGETLELQLELKLIADVGLVGLPNAGKSTLLSVISNARPEIADYPFTTLTPNLGVVDVDKDSSMLFADIPGLIEGAAEGKGLGDEFLRHVERTAILLHLVDANSKDIAADYQTIQAELGQYKVNLAEKPQLVAISKIDTVTPEVLKAQQELLAEVLPKGTPIFSISSQAHQNLQSLLYAVREAVQTERARQAEEAPEDEDLPVLRLKEELPWRVSKVDTGYLVTGHKIEKFAARTDFENREGVERLRAIMKKMGISHELARQGAKPDSVIYIGSAGTITYN